MKQTNKAKKSDPVWEKVPGASWISWVGDVMLLATFEPPSLKQWGHCGGEGGREGDTGWLMQLREH